MADVAVNFKSLMAEIKNPDNEAKWKEITETDLVTEAKLPESLEIKLDMFQKLIIYKIFREEKLISLVKNYVLSVLGKTFI